MDYHWEVEVKPEHARRFSRLERMIWRGPACEVLKDIARSKGLCVATSPQEEDHGHAIRTFCEKCKNRECSPIMFIWKPGHYESGVEVPRELNGARHVCSHRFPFPPPVFSIEGHTRTPTFSFCQVIEAVLAFLFPGRFMVEYDWGIMISRR